MSQPNRKKLEKRRRRQKAIKKRRNIEHNLSEPRWRLDVFLEGKWYTVRKWRNESKIDEHVADTERRRKAGEVIAAGRVVDLKTGDMVREIKPSAIKGTLPDAGATHLKGQMPLVEEPNKGAKDGLLGKLFGKD